MIWLLIHHIIVNIIRGRVAVENVVVDQLSANMIEENIDVFYVEVKVYVNTRG
uniref:Uncharacterized protein n=1 Tax=Pithovirus LCPAC401 TaxID=2506595 RepID=A0A481ZAG9_9VIRU|nr:MAG: hypothetical protein LCPAC401_02640 [Pithovirus LCPAC401]